MWMIQYAKSARIKTGRKSSEAHFTLIPAICMMVAAPFIAYIGPFTSECRTRLWETTWIPDLRGKGIPCNDELDPLSLLSDVAMVQAQW